MNDDLALLVVQNGQSRLAIPHVGNVMTALEANRDKLQTGEDMEVFVFDSETQRLIDHWVDVA